MCGNETRTSTQLQIRILSCSRETDRLRSFRPRHRTHCLLLLVTHSRFLCARPYLPHDLALYAASHFSCRRHANRSSPVSRRYNCGHLENPVVAHGVHGPPTRRAEPPVRCAGFTLPVQRTPTHTSRRSSSPRPPLARHCLL